MDLNFYLGCIKFSTLVAILFASCFANLEPFVFLDYSVGVSELLLVELYLRKKKNYFTLYLEYKPTM